MTQSLSLCTHTHTHTHTHKDNVPPNITLNGNRTITLAVGDNFTDPGYSASDLFSNVTVQVWHERKKERKKARKQERKKGRKEERKKGKLFSAFARPGSPRVMFLFLLPVKLTLLSDRFLDMLTQPSLEDTNWSILVRFFINEGSRKYMSNIPTPFLNNLNPPRTLSFTPATDGAGNKANDTRLVVVEGEQVFLTYAECGLLRTEIFFLFPPNSFFFFLFFFIWSWIRFDSTKHHSHRGQSHECYFGNYVC